MQNRPDHPTLLEALTGFLMSDVAPKLEADKALQFRVLIAANLATVIAGELRTQEARLAAEGSRLARLLGSAKAPESPTELDALNRVLAQKLRSGMPLTTETLEHLMATARETLEVTNARFQLTDEL
jgi:hypothetical protein